MFLDARMRELWSEMNLTKGIIFRETINRSHYSTDHEERVDRAQQVLDTAEADV